MPCVSRVTVAEGERIFGGLMTTFIFVSTQARLGRARTSRPLLESAVTALNVPGPNSWTLNTTIGWQRSVPTSDTC